MSRRFTVAALALVCLLLSARFAQAAEEILKLVPDSALGFMVINRPGVADTKVQDLGRQMGLPVPSLLAKLKQEGGIREGLDEGGTAAVLVLPPERDAEAPTPIVLLPVTDYGKFLRQFKAEGTAAGLSKIELWGVEGTWVRKIGGYAALTDAHHRDALEKTLRLSEKVPAALAPWRAWLAENDAAGVILQPGIKLLSAKVQEGIRMLKSSVAQTGQDAKMVAAVFDIYATLFQAMEREVSTAGVSVQLDKRGVLRVTKRVRMVPGGQWARLAAQVQPAKENLLKGLPAGPFVVAGGGVVPEAFWDAMMKFSFDMIKAMPQLYGLSEEQVKKLSEASVGMMKSARAMSVVLGVGTRGAPMYSSFVAAMRVDRAEEFMAGYEKSVKQYSQVLKDTQSPMLQPPAIERSEINGTPALRITMKAPQAPGSEQIPQYAKMMEAFFGPGGKLVAWLVPADEHTVVMGYVSKEPLQEAIRLVKQGKPGLAGDAEVSKTAALLPPRAPWVLYWSPKGTIDFAGRMIPALLPPGAELPFKLPEFPNTPPIGFAVTTAADEIQGQMVVPAEVFKAIGQCVGKPKPQDKVHKVKGTEEGRPVSGRVLLDGRPPAGEGQIQFAPQEKGDSKALPIKDGKFKGQLKPGQYHVGIRAPGVPAKYTPETSGLIVEVGDGPNAFDFNLISR